MECDVTDPSSSSTILILEPKSLRPFKSRDEYMYAMKEDLADWFYCLYKLDINVNNFFEQLETGVTMCKHANSVQKFTKEAIRNGCKPSLDYVRIFNIPIDCDIPYFAWAKPRTFQARDNLSNFICWCRGLGIPQVLLFETDDLVLRKNERSVVLCLLEMARVGAKLGMLAPTIVQMEAEIDAEIEGRAEPPPQIKTCDLRSLDEMVRDLVNMCSCPSQFPIIKMCEGKYKVGESESLIFVRVLRKHVMVRVGGGWDTLEHYLDKHDPCRCHYMGHRFNAMGGTKRPTTPGVQDKRSTNPGVQEKRSTTSGVQDKRLTTPGVQDKRLTTPGVQDKRLTTPGVQEKQVLSRTSRSQSVCADPIERDTELTRTRSKTPSGIRANSVTETAMDTYRQRYRSNKDTKLDNSKQGSDRLDTTCVTPYDERVQNLAHGTPSRNNRTATPNDTKNNELAERVNKIRSRTPNGFMEKSEASYQNRYRNSNEINTTDTDEVSKSDRSLLNCSSKLNINHDADSTISPSEKISKLKHIDDKSKPDLLYAYRKTSVELTTADEIIDISDCSVPHDLCNCETYQVNEQPQSGNNLETKCDLYNISEDLPQRETASPYSNDRKVLCRRRLPFGAQNATAVRAQENTEPLRDSGHMSVNMHGSTDDKRDEFMDVGHNDEDVRESIISIETEEESYPTPLPKMDTTGHINMEEISTMSLAQFKTLLNTALSVPGSGDSSQITANKTGVDNLNGENTHVTPTNRDVTKTKNGYAPPRAKSTPPISRRCVSDESLDRGHNTMYKPRRTLPQSPVETKPEISNNNSAITNRYRSRSRPASARAVTPGTTVTPDKQTSIPRPVNSSAIPRPISAAARSMSVDRLNRGSEWSVQARGRSPLAAHPSSTPVRPQSRPSSPGPRMLTDQNVNKQSDSKVTKSVRNPTFSGNKPKVIATVSNDSKRPGSATVSSSTPSDLNSANGDNSSRSNASQRIYTKNTRGDSFNNTPRKQSVGSASRIIASRKMTYGTEKAAPRDNSASGDHESNRGRPQTRSADTEIPRSRPRSAGPRLLPKADTETITITRSNSGQHLVKIDMQGKDGTRAVQQRRASTGVSNPTHHVSQNGNLPQTSATQRYMAQRQSRLMPQKQPKRPQSADPRSSSRERNTEDFSRGRGLPRNGDQGQAGSGTNSENRRDRHGSVTRCDRTDVLRPDSAVSTDKNNGQRNDRSAIPERASIQRRALPTHPRRCMTPNSLDYDQEFESRPLSEIQAALGLKPSGQASSTNGNTTQGDEKIYRRMEFLFEKYRQKELRESVQAAYENREHVIENSEDSETAYTAEDEASLDSNSNKKSDDDDLFNTGTKVTHEDCKENRVNILVSNGVNSDRVKERKEENEHTEKDSLSNIATETNCTGQKLRGHFVVSSRDRKQCSVVKREAESGENEQSFINKVKSFNKQMCLLPSSKTPTNDSFESGLGFDSCGGYQVIYTGTEEGDYLGSGMERQDSLASLSDASSSTSGCRSETPVPKLPKPLTTGRSTLLVKKDRMPSTSSTNSNSQKLLCRSVSMDSSTACLNGLHNGHFKSSSSSVDEDVVYM